MRAWDSEEGGGGRAQEEEVGKKEANWASPELSLQASSSNLGGGLERSLNADFVSQLIFEQTVFVCLLSRRDSGERADAFMTVELMV